MAKEDVLVDRALSFITAASRADGTELQAAIDRLSSMWQNVNTSPQLRACALTAQLMLQDVLRARET